jgi:hypothetical protein
MYEPIPIRTTERLIHHGSQLVIHATVAFFRKLWTMDHLLRGITLPFLIFGIEYAAHALGFHGPHHPPEITAVEVVLVLFVMLATVFGGPQRR